jgi:hypothetical protein
MARLLQTYQTVATKKSQILEKKLLSMIKKPNIEQKKIRLFLERARSHRHRGRGGASLQKPSQNPQLYELKGKSFPPNQIEPIPHSEFPILPRLPFIRTSAAAAFHVPSVAARNAAPLRFLPAPTHRRYACLRRPNPDP